MNVQYIDYTLEGEQIYKFYENVNAPQYHTHSDQFIIISIHYTRPN